MATIKTFWDLQVWQKAHQLVLVVYKITGSFPTQETYGLVSQLRRAALSVASNIVEGFKRRSVRDSIHFYNMADASLEEVKLHGFTAVASCRTGFRGAEPRTESHSSTGLCPWLSGAWVKYQLLVARDLNYINKQVYEATIELAEEVSKMLRG